MSTMTTVTGQHRIVIALREHGDDVEREVGAELAVLAQWATNRMRILAAKGATTTLTNSIKADQVDALTWDIGPHVSYAPFVEAGVKPGGKGLPRFFDPASRSIVQWLQSKVFKGQHKPGMATRALQSAEKQLRDRYEGLAWHIRHKGVRAQPFVEPVAAEMETLMFNRLDLAVRRTLGKRPDGAPLGGAAA